jgi:thioredoxin-like negative regulator of GroEL
MVLPHASDQFYARLLVDISDGLGHDDEVIAVLDDYADSLAKPCDCGRRCGSWQAEELIAAVLERQGEIESAIRLLQGNVHRHNSTNVNVVQHLADVLARHDRHDELRALINGYGKEYAAHRFALHLESVGDVEGAIAVLAPMAADGNRNPSSFLAGILLRAKRTDEAIDVLTRALPRDPECLLSSWREIMVKHGRTEEALTIVEQLASEPQGLTERLYEARVCLLAVCGRGEQALQEVTARSADEWNAAEEVSYALSAVGQLDLAVKVLEVGFREGDHQEPMALLMSQQGRIDDALAMLPRTRDMNLYIPPALRPKIQRW